MDVLRLFIAVRCPSTPGLRRVLADLEALRPAVTPVNADHLHFTLRFLGDTPADRVPDLAGALDRAVSDVHPGQPGPFALPFAGLGTFPPSGRRPPRVVFAQLAQPKPLERLAAAVTDQLAGLDPTIAPDGRPFRPHLTLARVKPVHPRGRRRRVPRYQRQAGHRDPRQQIAHLLANSAQHDLGTAHLTTVALIASQLTPTGPIYTPRHEVTL